MPRNGTTSLNDSQENGGYDHSADGDDEENQNEEDDEQEDDVEVEKGEEEEEEVVVVVMEVYLGAKRRLYNSLRLSVRPSIGWSVGPHGEILQNLLTLKTGYI
jgi:hypothetical protein